MWSNFASYFMNIDFLTVFYLFIHAVITKNNSCTIMTQATKIMTPIMSIIAICPSNKTH